LAASAPFLPNAVRVFAGKWEMVFLDLAAVAAFLMFFLAAARCFSVLIAFLAYIDSAILAKPDFLFANQRHLHSHRPFRQKFFVYVGGGNRYIAFGLGWVTTGFIFGAALA
jgi:hypothetical protein